MCSDFSRLTLLLCIHIALRPDKSGFKATGAQGLSLSPSIDILLRWSEGFCRIIGTGGTGLNKSGFGVSH